MAKVKGAVVVDIEVCKGCDLCVEPALRKLWHCTEM